MWKKKIQKKLEAIFQSMACDNPYEAVCVTAASAAAIVAALPPFLDTWALRLAEVLMLVSIYSHYGVKISTSVARTIMTSGFAQTVGSEVALVALEAADAAIVLNPLIGYGIKVSIAVGIISAIGLATIKSLDGGGSPAAEALVNAMCSVGLGGDLNRVASGISKLGGIPKDGEYAAKLDAEIAKAQEKSASWGDALQAVYDDPGCESSGAFEMLAKDHWDKRLEKLVEAKKNL